MQRILSATTIATTDETQSKWIEVGSKWECYTPEAYLDSSRGKVPTLEECKESCLASTGCKSITYLSSKWCSHYSALCSKTTWNKKVVGSYYLKPGAALGSCSYSTPSTVGKTAPTKYVCLDSVHASVQTCLPSSSLIWKSCP